MHPGDKASCFASHMGAWLYEPTRFIAAVAAIQSGLWTPPGRNSAFATMENDSDSDDHGPVMYGAIGVVSLHDALMKQQSKFGGTSTVLARRQIRALARDNAVAGIMLDIDSPGGTCAGTFELAEEIKTANAVKPVWAHISDVGASAAYWAASQAGRVICNAPAEVGCIGVVAVACDTSGAYDRMGIKVHVVATGPLKGSFVDGAPITDEQLAYLRGLVDAHNARFLSAVAAGRKVSVDSAAKWATGAVFPSAVALEMGLVDSVASFDDAISEMASAVKSPGRTPSATSTVTVRDFAAYLTTKTPTKGH